MITKLKITIEDIPQHRSHNPILTALYRGIYYRGNIESKQGSFQGKVDFDVVNQCYWISTGEYGRPLVKAGKLLHAWLSAWNHGKEIFPITIHFTENIAEVECEDSNQFLSFWK